jgi:thymidylate synthase
MNMYPTADDAWLRALHMARQHGRGYQPRGLPTLELYNASTVMVDMQYPVVQQRARKLSYSFMAAEALWITDGSDRLEHHHEIAKKLALYSDDGRTLNGAYGPRIMPQVPYVVDALVKDRDTRQAALTVWTPRRAGDVSKDVPCTVAMVFGIRDGQLHCHAFMRSSDVWMGLPYDIFSFSMVSALVACQVNALLHPKPHISLGRLTITAASSHLYQRDVPAADVILGLDLNQPVIDDELPQRWIAAGAWSAIRDALLACRDNTAQQTAWPIRPRA